MTDIGFIGLGIMGHGMATNLVKAGFSVTVWNRTQSKADDIIEAGAIRGQTPADVAREADIVMICVSDTPDVEAVVFGPDGVIEGVRPDSLIIDHSTISPQATQRFASIAADHGTHWIDAPISGGSEGAVNGTLTIMIGGDEEQIQRSRAYLDAIGTTITHVGPLGSGQLVKAVNQILVVVTQLAVSEALLLAEAGGLDLDSTLRAVEGGAAGSWMLSNRGPQMIDRDWRPGFTIDLQQKDLRIVLEAADELGVPLPGTAIVFQMFRALQQQGLGGDGNHALVKALERMSGIEVGSRDG
ncbi:MAG: NAD(P)-dependent oxidoreductase [Actinomycetia bacterium]|nr:NAD(P)-dependent oxidoreductase [Actinomycetes bacterium]